MSILQSIEEIIALHDKYASVRYDDKNYHVTLLIDMFNQWHSQSSKLFSRYLPSEDLDLVKFKDAEIRNANVLSGVFNELESTFHILVDKLRMSSYCKLEVFILEGETIVKTIKYQEPPHGIIRMFKVYLMPNESEYQIWKNKCLRLLESNYYRQVNALVDFKSAVEKFEKSHYAPKYMHEMIGILKSLVDVPVNSSVESQAAQQNSTTPLTLNLYQNQSQTLNIDFKIIWDSIGNELTGKDLKELKELIEMESEPQAKKTKVLDKLKSFGSDVLSNIIANIITNPIVLSGL